MDNLEILLVDDDHVVNLIHQRLIGKVFPEVKIKVYTAAKDCLVYLKNNPLQDFLLLLDIHMPQMNGWQFLMEMDDEYRAGNIEVVILSSSFDSRDIERSKDFKRVTEYIQKPLLLGKLVEIRENMAIS